MSKSCKAYRENEQLCWCCAKATGANNNWCSWSRDLKPVDGWKAIPVTQKPQYGCKNTIHTYQIIECPEFVRDTNDSVIPNSRLPHIKRSRYTDAGCKRLVEELVYRAGCDLLATDKPVTEYYLSDFLHTLGADSILSKILRAKGKTFNDVQRDGKMVE